MPEYNGVPIQVIPRGKRSLAKAKRELPLTDMTGQLGSPDYQTRQSRLIPHDASRQGIETQVQQLKAAIRRNLYSIASLLKSGNEEKAAFTCGIVASQRNRIVYLLEQYEAASKLEAEAMADPKYRKPRIKAVAKVKRFKMFSDK